MAKTNRQKSAGPALTIKTFGYFNILYNGESVFYGQNNAVKPLEILKFLIVNIGKEVSIETIVENIWPDNEYYDEKTVIRTYIHRLRKVIAAENRFNTDFSGDLRIHASKGRYRLEISDRVDLDIDRLTELNDVIAALPPAEAGSDITEVGSLADTLLSVYTGSFIADAPFAAWTVMYRNYYTRIFSNSLNTLLDFYKNAGDNEKLIELCEASLKIYDLDEKTNIFFMNALIDSGRAAVALQHYSYITKKMYTELAVSPSDRMLEVYGRMKTDKSPVNAGAGAGATARQLISEEDFSDAERIISIINDLNDVAQKIMIGMDKYSVGYVLLKQSPGAKSAGCDDEELQKILEKAIRLSLRKNDMYAVFGPHHAVIILSDAQEAYYSLIIKRLNEEFYKSYNGLDLVLSVEISRVTTLR